MPEEWKYLEMVFGEPSVMIFGVWKKQKLYADNLGKNYSINGHISN